jgi:hypothetical protein
MQIQRDSSCHLSSIVVFVATMAIAGCGDSESRVAESTKVQSSGNDCCATADRQSAGSYGKVMAQEMEGASRLPYGSLLEAHQSGSQQALRVRVDAARNRLWVLGLDHVYVYDIANKRLIRRIALPGWSVASFICPPDMALDRSGAAFISHNVQPRLWQIDADSFQLKEHVIRLLNREGWEIGFGGLAFAPDGTLFGVTALAGSLWWIDIGNARAHQIELDAPVLDACDLISPGLASQGTPDRNLAICASAGRLPRRIEVSSDLTHGRVSKIERAMETNKPSAALRRMLNQCKVKNWPQ